MRYPPIRSFGALCLISVVLLLVTGVIDDTYVMLFFGLIGVPANATAESLQHVMDALRRGDYTTLISVGSGVVKPALFVYVTRAVIYVLALALLLWWLAPRLAQLLALVQEAPDDDTPLPATVDLASARPHIVRLLRRRAGRKRTEAFLCLGAALVTLAVGIGFITRGIYGETPLTFSSEAIDVEDVVANVNEQTTAIQTAIADRWTQVAAQDEAVSSLIQALSEHASGAQASEGQGDARQGESTAEAIRALAEHGFTRRNEDVTTLSATVQHQLTFAAEQLKVMDRLAGFEMLQQSVFAVATRLGALILILVLVKLLVKVYGNGIRLATAYDASADFIELCSDDALDDPRVLRSALTPDSDGDTLRGTKSASMFDAIQEEITRLRKAKGSPART